MGEPPNQPPYPQPEYPDYRYGPPSDGQPPHLPARQPAGLRIDLGARSRTRPEPRPSTTLAGAGAVLLLVGLLIWSGGYLAEGFVSAFGDPDTGPPGTGRRFLGFALFSVLAVVGYALVIVRRTGPLATAGATVGAFGVPLALVFVTLSVSVGGPFNVDAVYLVSILVWLVAYLFLPGARGRVLFLTLAAISLPSYIGLKAVQQDVTRAAFGGLTGLSPGAFDTSTIGAIGLVFGLAYYLAATLLDRRGRAGSATALVIAGFVVTQSGVTGVANSFGRLGTGVLLIVLGVLLSAYGAWAGRRFTSWIWAAGFLLGVGLVVTDAIEISSYVAIGVTLAAVGLVVVAVSAAVAQVRGERPDIAEPDGPTPPAGPFPPGPYQGPPQGPFPPTPGPHPSPYPPAQGQP